MISLIQVPEQDPSHGFFAVIKSIRKDLEHSDFLHH